MKLARAATSIALFNFILLMALFSTAQTPRSVSVSGVKENVKTVNNSVIQKAAAPAVVSRPKQNIIKEIKPPQNDRCIVVVKGNSYDVTTLKGTHSGGDIFLCGADMTVAFFGQHERQLLNTTMKQYLIK